MLLAFCPQFLKQLQSGVIKLEEIIHSEPLSTTLEFMIINLFKAWKDEGWLPKEQPRDQRVGNFSPIPPLPLCKAERGAGDLV